MKKTTISQFNEALNKVTGETTRNAIIKKHVISHYAPIREKIAVLKLMNEKSIAQGKHGQYIDLTVSKMNLVMAVLVLYTDLIPDVNTSGESLSWEAYDFLKSTGTLEVILNTIGKDLDELISVQEQIMGTWQNENTTTAAYINNLVEKVGMIFSTALGKELGGLAETLAGASDEDKTELFGLLKQSFGLK